MIYDFVHTCNTYDKKNYSKEYFRATRCPKCPAVGRFNMHSCYKRYAILFVDGNIEIEFMEIKRIICESCGTTHAVMPGDIIPYSALTLYVFIYVLASYYIKKTPALNIAKELGFSYQLVYLLVAVFLMHRNHIEQQIRETAPEDIPAALSECGILLRIERSGIDFQRDYIKTNRRPCFMSKFFDSTGAPPIGIYCHIMGTT